MKQAAQAKRSSMMERLALNYLHRKASGLPPPEDVDGVHILSPEERASLRSIERKMVLQAAVVGAIAGLVAALAQIEASPLLGAEPDSASMDQRLNYWLIMGPIFLVTTLIEIVILYWHSLYSVHALSRATGVQLFAPEVGSEEGVRPVAVAMARAALEIPNPVAEDWAIDPFRETGRISLFFAAVAYKAKVGLTSFIVKALIRRLAGRTFLRAWLVFVGVPVTAFWDASVAFMVIRQAHIRAMGPSAAEEVARSILGDHEHSLSEEARVAVLRAVGGSIVRSQDAHPNLVALLRAVDKHVGPVPGVVLDDTAIFLADLEQLESSEQSIVLQVLATAAILDGRLARKERHLLRDAQQRCGRQPDLKGVKRLREAFIAGEPLNKALLKNATGR